MFPSTILSLPIFQFVCFLSLGYFLLSISNRIEFSSVMLTLLGSFMSVVLSYFGIGVPYSFMLSIIALIAVGVMIFLNIEFDQVMSGVLSFVIGFLFSLFLISSHAGFLYLCSLWVHKAVLLWFIMMAGVGFYLFLDSNFSKIVHRIFAILIIVFSLWIYMR